MEIGFYDNASDLNYLQNNYDKIYTQKINDAPNFEIFKRERG